MASNHPASFATTRPLFPNHSNAPEDAFNGYHPDIYSRTPIYNSPYGALSNSVAPSTQFRTNMDIPYEKNSNTPHPILTPTPTARQRTAQACEKCRSRKTKARLLIS